MKLYNTLARTLVDVSPLTDKTIRMYSCGPTVYDHAHIGNLSAYIFADTLRRTIREAGYDVQHVMNYTDVDDKTIRRSQQDASDSDPKSALKKLTDEYIQIFNHDMRRIGNDVSALTFIRATDPKTITGMQQLIAKLLEGGFAYIADDGVYFSIEAYRKSGKVYGQLSKVEASNTSKARIQNDEYDKESVHDFALWKKHRPGEPAWDFTLDGQDLTGRPGWHIECSVMSRQLLNQPFDIHTGGIDLIFPHHENEIAQSTALEANPIMATIFAHNDHILVDGKKMAKSAQNFYTLDDIVAKKYDPLAFRLRILQAHYRSQLNFSWESLDAAQNLLGSIRAWADLKHQKAASGNEALGDAYAMALKKILAAMQNDLATPAALSILAELVSQSEQEGVDDTKIQPLLNVLDRLFGLELADRPDISHAQKDLIADREQARQTENWDTSDKLREALLEQGIGLRDTQRGPIWYKV